MSVRVRTTTSIFLVNLSLKVPVNRIELYFIGGEHPEEIHMYTITYKILCPSVYIYIYIYIYVCVFRSIISVYVGMCERLAVLG